MNKPSPSLIREELDRILGDRHFQGANRASAFLKYIVEETLSGRDNRLKEYTIGIEVFQKGNDFLPQADPSVRIDAGRLRKKLDQYYLTKKEEGVEISIPKGGYVPRFRFHASRLPGGEIKLKPPTLSVKPFESQSTKEPALITELLYQEMKKAVGKSDDFALLGDSDINSDFQITGKLYKRRSSFILYCDLLRSDSGTIVWTESFPLKNPGRFPLRMAEAVAAQVAAVVAGRGGVLYDLLGEQMQNTEEIPEDILGIRILFVLHKKLMEPGIAGRLRIALERLINKHENRGDLRAFLSQMYWDFCMDVDWNATVNHDDSFAFYREKALKLAAKAKELDPEGEDTLVSGIRSAFHEEDIETLRALTERLFRSNDVSALSMATGALLYSLSGGWETGITILENTLPLIPSYPGWFHHLTCQYHLRQMDYEIVISKAGRFTEGDVLWYYIYTAAALGLLGNIIEGKAYWEELLRQCPAFKKGVRNFLSNYVKETQLLELILSGLTAVKQKPPPIK
ncbi:MAG: hypothetical protein JEZ04_07370 [Spirochaetales bacterium]|nr:hypothetical protein [Spirochaetales bacterium]